MDCFVAESLAMVMKRRVIMRFLAAWLAVVCLGSVWYAADPKWSFDASFNVISGDHLGAQGALGMGILSKDDRPVACFGLTKVPGQKARYSYLLIIKAAPAGPKDGLETAAEGKAANQDKGYVDINGTFKYRGKTVEIQYKADIDAGKKLVSGEVLKLGGKEVKVDGPRIFLVDLTAAKVMYTPVKVEGVEELPAGKWEQAVGETIEQLKKKSPEVKRFLE
jgi:hypothetical protein